MNTQITFEIYVVYLYDYKMISVNLVRKLHTFSIVFIEIVS